MVQGHEAMLPLRLAMSFPTLTHRLNNRFACPSWLVTQPAAIPRDTDYIEGFKHFDYAVCQKVVFYPDVVVNKRKDYRDHSALLYAN